MKPFYSVADLGDLLEQEPLEVADGLNACGVRMVYNGQDADLSEWYARRATRRPDGAIRIVVRQGGPLPSPEEVMVAAHLLPDMWKTLIEQRDSPRDPLSAPTTDSSTWPWGSYSTKLLGHLAAAAERFWVNYDPDDHSTALKNNQVAEWLECSPREVSRSMAEKIATILRADGLPTGPRR